MAMRTFSIVPFSLILLALACSKTEAPPEAKPELAEPAAEAKPELAEPGTKAPSAEPELLLPVGPVVVELIDAGKPPLQPVRWQLRKGSKDQVRMKSEMTLEAQVGTENSPRTETPTVQHLLSVETMEVSPDGTAQMRLEVSNAMVLEGSSAPAQMLSQLKRSVMSTKGRRGTYEISASGAVRQVEINKSGILPMNLQAIDNIEQLVYWTTVPVPSEPIGLGAKWKAMRVTEEGGLRIEQQASYELTKIEGSSFEVKVLVEKTAKPQTVIPPGATENESFELTGFDWKGTGQVQADFSRPVPVSSKIDAVANMNMKTPGPQGVDRELKVMMETSSVIEGI